MDNSMIFREQARASDGAVIRSIVAATGFFNSGEIDIAVELLEERMHKGASSGYEFIFAEQAGEVLGYTCFGLIPCTLASYDLYWIAVDPRRQKCGLGQTLMRQTKETVRRLGGTRIYADTSGRSQYQPTRSFYLKCGFRLDALLKDFYAPADDKCIFVLQL